MSMDLSDVLMDEDFIEEFQLVSFVSGVRDADSGKFTASYADPTPITESIQPTPQNMIQFLPEGERTKNSCTIYSKTPIYLGDGNAKESDLIIWRGDKYRVVVAQPWQSYGYYFVMATQISDGQTPLV